MRRNDLRQLERYVRKSGGLLTPGPVSDLFDELNAGPLDIGTFTASYDGREYRMVVDASRDLGIAHYSLTPTGRVQEPISSKIMRDIMTGLKNPVNPFFVLPGRYPVPQ